MAGFVATTPNTKRKEGVVVNVPVATGQVINQGDIVVVKVSDGYAYKSFYEGAADMYFAGIAAETVDTTKVDPETGSTYASGALSVDLWQEGVFYFAKDTAAAVDRFKVAYATIADTGSAQTVIVTGNSTLNPAIGVITEIVSSTIVGVNIEVTGTATATPG